MIEEWRSAGVDALQIIFHDYNGIARARSVRLDQLPAVFDRGVNFSSPTLDFNSQDLFPRDAAFDLASPDVWAKPDPDTFWSAPVSPTTGHMYADLVDARGRPWEGCVRSALRRAVDRAAARGVSFQVGFEPEGYVFSGRDEGIAAIGTPQFATLDGLDRHEEYAAELIANLAAAGIDVEQWTKEYGAGQIEVNLRYGPALVSADRLATFKHLFRAIARRHGLLGTFMPKPLATAAGSGLHVHLSATPTGGEARNLFDDPGDTELALSTIGRQALAG
jgi:glutamine synthetase